MTPNQVKQRKRDRKKSVRNTGSTRQTHHQATIMIRPTIVISGQNNVRGKAIRKSIQ